MEKSTGTVAHDDPRINFGAVLALVLRAGVAGCLFRLRLLVKLFIFLLDYVRGAIIRQIGNKRRT